jgi:hypothetical protein
MCYRIYINRLLEAEVGELLCSRLPVAFLQFLFALPEWIRLGGAASLLLILDEFPEFQDVQFVRG